MCLAVPSKIVEIDGNSAVVDVDGVRRACNVAFLENPRIGDYVLLHAGFAIQKWTTRDYKEYVDIVGGNIDGSRLNPEP